MGFFSPAPARIVSASADEIGRRFRLIRIRQVSIMLLGYALFYVCRLAFSATKKTMIEEGAYTAREIGYVGSALLVAYAIGKLACGFLADRANIRRMFAFGLFVSSLATMTVGFHVPAAMLMVVWFVNGLAQGSGSPCCVVSLAALPKKPRFVTAAGSHSGAPAASSPLPAAPQAMLSPMLLAS
jgi:OPA family sugar phosphate sensor protein UhpC-like MFS transporter